MLEVSEIDEPAIGEEFYIVKREGSMEDLISDEVLTEVEKKLGKDARESIKQAINILQPLYKDAPDDIKKAIETLAGFIGVSINDKYPYPEVEKEITKNLESKMNTVLRLLERLAEELEKLKADINAEKEKKMEVKKDVEVKTEEVKKSEEELPPEKIDELLNLMKEKVEERNAIVSGLKKLIEERQ
jgi:hypothetical protein